MSRLALILWLCAGALALGILVQAANRRGIYIGKTWYVVGLLLGPIFLCFVVPMWIGKFGDRKDR